MKQTVCDNSALPIWFKLISVMQEYLRFISDFYPSIPKVFVNGFFGADMTAAVVAFQREFELPDHGRIDLATWEMIVAVYRSLEKMSVGGGEINLAVASGNIVVASLGEAENVIVPVLQAVLADLAKRYENMPDVSQSGVYDEQTARAVQEFRRLANLNGDEDMLDRETWNRLLAFWDSLAQ